ncbi:hypothetical protein GGI07_001535 [Coemansia sp. Benny D115]|nr:hypothetical protein GGI07_001535 [Coemansia sp. Benny D115]
MQAQVQPQKQYPPQTTTGNIPDNGPVPWPNREFLPKMPTATIEAARQTNTIAPASFGELPATSESAQHGQEGLKDVPAVTGGVQDDGEVFVPRSFNARTLESDADGAATTARHRPEVGISTTSSDSASSSTTAGWNGVDDFIQTATEASSGAPRDESNEQVWARILRPTKTSGLPDLLEIPHHTPEAMRLAPAERPAIGGVRLDPAKAGGIDLYPAAELSSLGSADAPGKIEEDVWRVVESLTLEEKIGQMLQVPVSRLMGVDGQLNATAVDFWVNTAKAGAFVDMPGNSAHGRFAWYAPQTLANLTGLVQRAALAGGSRVPALWAADAVRGASFVKQAAIFPAGVGLAATMQPQFAYAAGRIAAKDMRAAGYSVALAASADLGVDKRSALGSVGFGEDPAVASAMVRHTVRGLQGNYKQDRQRVAACVRHFIGGGAVPDNALFEYHLPGFQAAIGAGVAALEQQQRMALNGQALGAAPFYLRTLLRDSMAFRGVMFGEALAPALLHAAANATDAMFLALNNTSVDIAADPTQFDAMADLVRSGTVPEDRVTESAARILQLKKDLGLYDHPFADDSLGRLVGALQDVEAARSAVRESLTLLKNTRRALPLNPDERVLFIGPHLNSTALLSGRWSVHRGGPTAAEAAHDRVFEGLGHSVIQGVQQLLGKTPVFHQGFNLDAAASADDDREFEALVKMARQSDKIVIGLGDPAHAASGDVEDLALDPRQIAFVRRLAAAVGDRPLVALLVSGRPRLLHQVADVASAVVMAYLPGVHGGLPIAQVLYGQASPSGRLPFTYPRFEYQARDTIWQSRSAEYAPQWPFGFGLGYAPMAYSNITVSSSELRRGSPVTVRLTIHNQGTIDQLEPVMMYTTQSFRTGYDPELFRLRKFDKVEVKAGTTTEVAFTLNAEELAYYNRDLVRVLDPSPVNITINALTPHERTVTVNLVI